VVIIAPTHQPMPVADFRSGRILTQFLEEIGFKQQCSHGEKKKEHADHGDKGAQFFPVPV